MFVGAEIPYGCYWSTPFAKWQKSFSRLHSIRFAAHVARHELARRGLSAASFDHAVLGFTVPQWRSFWGAPWAMQLIGNAAVPGQTVVQACQTGPRCLATAAREVAAGEAECSLVITCDRTSDAPYLVYPAQGGPGGQPLGESYVFDNFNDDPVGRRPVLATAEAVARRWNIGRQEQDELVLRRYEQYADARRDGAAFHRRYMSLPFDVPDADFARTTGRLDGDEGVTATDAGRVRGLAPVAVGGTVTYAGQTHPADGNACIVVASPERSREMSRDPRVRVRVLAFAQGRAEPGYMPYAPVIAARKALRSCGLEASQLKAIKSHNPFIVNDLVFARETGLDPMRMNNFGCSLVFGHPQGSTGTRLVIELIEELALQGGGIGLYHGCAAGDSGAALVIEVGDRPA